MTVDAAPTEPPPLSRRYLFSSPSKTWYQTRGGPVFEMWQQLGLDVHIHQTGMFRLQLPAWMLLPVHPNPELAEMMRDWRQRPQTVTVVDVCFPLGRPDCYVGLDGPDREAIAFWTRPEVRQAGFDLIAAADAVTVPYADWDGYPGWIDDLAEVNPNVHVLPDLRAGDPDGVEQFAGGLMNVWQSTRRTKQKRQAVRRRHRPEPGLDMT